MIVRGVKVTFTGSHVHFHTDSVKHANHFRNRQVFFRIRHNPAYKQGVFFFVRKFLAFLQLQNGLDQRH